MSSKHLVLAQQLCLLGSMPPVIAPKDYRTVQQRTLAGATSSACQSMAPSNEEHVRRHRAKVLLAGHEQLVEHRG